MSENINILKYMSKTYTGWPCWNLVSDFYKQEFNIYLPYFQDNKQKVTPSNCALKLQEELEINKSLFSETNNPVNFDIVLMAKNNAMHYHHVGIFYEHYVLHATNKAVFYEPFFLVEEAYPKKTFIKIHRDNS